ncbi:MAG: YXWGXW repeat-containing protein, partial [Terriglobales bacterium]
MALVVFCAQLRAYEVIQMRIVNVRRSLPSFGAVSWLVLAAFLLAITMTSSMASAQIVLSVNIAPPPLPVYTQPACPGDGYIWTPGYWAYSDDGGYFWVPGTWVQAPEVGFLWTPGYWGWANSLYVWNAGYWGPQVGFYGGIDYGFGYTGNGYAGGYWNSGHFFYNSRVNNVNVTVVHNVYQRSVTERVNHASFNGGHGGISARPTATQERFAREKHIPAVSAQEAHLTAARADRSQFYSENHGHPAGAATARPGAFKG